jgi:hypothetical protein
MRDSIQLVGFVMTLQGISGAIDHLAVQPFMSLLLNFFNRVVIPGSTSWPATPWSPTSPWPSSGWSSWSPPTGSSRRDPAPRSPADRPGDRRHPCVPGYPATRNAACLASTSKSWSRWSRAAP